LAALAAVELAEVREGTGLRESLLEAGAILKLAAVERAVVGGHGMWLLSFVSPYNCGANRHGDLVRREVIVDDIDRHLLGRRRLGGLGGGSRHCSTLRGG